MDPKRPTPRYIIIKMTRLIDKEGILKATREKQVVTYKGAPVKLSSVFSKETFQARRERCDMFKVRKSNLQPRLRYPASLSLKNQRRNKELISP